MSSVRRKILSVTAVSLLVAGFVLEVFAIGYFKKALVANTLVGDELKLSLIAGNLDSFLSWQKTYAANLAADNAVQKCITDYGHASKLQKTRNVLAALNSLLEHKGIMGWVGVGVALDETTYFATAPPAVDDAYFPQVPLLARQPGAEVSVFTAPYYSEAASSRVVGYSVPVNSVRNIRTVQAQLVFEINYDRLRAIIPDNIHENFDGLYIVNTDNQIIYGYEEGDNALVKSIDFSQRPASYQDEDAFVTILYCDNADWAVMCYQNHSTVYQPINEQLFWVSLLFALPVLAAFSILVYLIIGRVLAPISAISDTMTKVMETRDTGTRLSIHTNDEFEKMAGNFNAMLSELEQSMQERLALEQTKSETEFALLIAQMNPHFIYNALNNISALIQMGRAGDARRMSSSLVDLLMNTIKMNDGQAIDTVEDEVKIAREYLRIQEIRYAGLFDTVWEVDPALLKKQMPKMVLQPLIENAIIHGLQPSGQHGSLRVAVKDAGGSGLCVQVANSGTRISPEILDRINRGEELPHDREQSTQVGISNINKRIRFLFGEGYGVSAGLVEGETVVTVLLPLLGREQGEEEQAHFN